MPSTPPLILQGRIIRLEALSQSHHDQLVAAARDGALWNLPYTVVPSEETMSVYIERALEMQGQGRELPFAIVHLATGKVIGSTRYMNIEPAHKRLEIGYTWLAASFQRTAANTEVKYLLLQQAFDVFGSIRVEFFTDVLNERSRAALVRIGAKEEGVQRNHMIMPNGRFRDSACFSIIQQEWPNVRRQLVERLASSEA
jgi:N-acetyltransferase